MFSMLLAPVLALAAQHPALPSAGGDSASPVAAERPALSERAERTLQLPPLLAAIRSRNPDLIALDRERAAALDRAIAAGSLPHPMVGFAVRNLPVDSFALDRDMMTMTEVMVRQAIPWFGKRGLRREAVERNAALARAEQEVQCLALEEAAVSAYANLWFATASVGVVREQREAIGRFARIARGRYASGGGSQSDLLRADVELARMEDPLLELEEMQVAARATLAALLDAPVDEVEGVPEAPPLPPLPTDLQPLLDRIASHPEVRALEEQARRSELEARLHEKERWPDPELELAYGVRALGADMVGVELMFTLPVFAGAKEDRLAAASRSEARAARSRRDALVRRLEGEVRSAFAAAGRQLELVRLYDEEIVPRAERNLASAIGSYQAGTVDFLTLLDARVQLQSQQLEALRARANYVRQLARLARAAGVSLFELSRAASEVEP